MKILAALFVLFTSSLHADPVVAPQLNLAVTELEAAIVQGLARIDDEELPPTRETLDWLGQSLAQINVIVQKAARKDPQAVNEFLTERLKNRFTKAFRPDEAPLRTHVKLRREFLDHIKDQVATDRFADHLAFVEREWRSGTEARVIAYVQTAAYFYTLALVTALVERYFDVGFQPAVWSGVFIGGAAILAATYKFLPWTTRFRDPANAVLRPVLDCANELLEGTSEPPPVIRPGTGRVASHVGRGVRRRPQRSEDSY